MEKLLHHTVRIDTLLNEFDEWDKFIIMLEMRKSLYEKYSQDIAETIEVVNEVDDSLGHATSMRDGSLKELSKLTGFEDVHVVRKFVIELKTMLNMYSERVSTDFINENQLEDLEQEDFIKLADDLLGNTDD